MEENIQKKHRETLTERYQLYAFEALALYNYWGQKYETQLKTVKEYEDRIANAEKAIVAIKELPDHHTVENRTSVNNNKKDIEQYKGLIAKVRPHMQELEKKLVKFQQDAGETLEQLECINSFVLKTPKQMAADKLEREKTLEAANPPIMHKCEQEGCENQILIPKTHCMHHDAETAKAA